MSVSTLVLLPRLGSACEIVSTQASALWTLVTPPSAATAACYLNCCRPPPLLPPPLAATTAAGHGRCRCRLPIPSTAAAIVGLSRHHRQPLPLPTPADPAAARHCCQPLLLSLPPSDDTAAAFQTLSPPVTAAAAVDCSLLRPPPPPPAPAATCHGRPAPPPRPTRSVTEALGTRKIPAKLAAILAAHSRTFRKDRTAHTPKERLIRVIHSSLAHLALREVPVPGLERVPLVGIKPEGRVILMHSLSLSG